MKRLCITAALALLAFPALAQTTKTVTPYGEEDKPKTQAEIEIERRTENAYKRSLSNMPESRGADPWGGVRSEPAKAAPAKKKSSTSN